MSGAPLDPRALADQVAARLAAVRGVRAVALGGSFARGDADAESDVDIGIYYRAAQPLDLAALRSLAAELDPADGRDAVTAPGAWGPWINGGAWLTVAGRRVDWIYRDLERVESVVADALAGRFTSDYQPGHPHAFHSYMYLGELEYAEVLHEADGVLQPLRASLRPYPGRLRHAVVERFSWEARFALETAGKPARRGDAWYVSGALFRSVACIVQVLFALNERYFTNEKGAVALIDSFDRRPKDFSTTVARVFAALGAGGDLWPAVSAIGRVVEEVEALAGVTPR